MWRISWANSKNKIGELEHNLTWSQVEDKLAARAVLEGESIRYVLLCLKPGAYAVFTDVSCLCSSREMALIEREGDEPESYHVIQRLNSMEVLLGNNQETLRNIQERLDRINKVLCITE